MGNELKELIILGCGPTKADCPYHTEVWGVNGTYTFAKKLDKLYMTDEESEVNDCFYDLVTMVKTGTTLVLPEPYKILAKTNLSIEVLPIEAILAKFPTRFYSNTIAYMIAHALTMTRTEQGPDDPLPHVVEGYHKIYFYGIDMMTGSTYIQEKGGVEYWMGVALGLGVEIINTPGSATGKTFNGKMYGHYGQWEEEKLKESLNMPFEMVRVANEKLAKGESPDWIRDPNSGEYRQVSKQADGAWKTEGEPEVPAKV